MKNQTIKQTGNWIVTSMIKITKNYKDNEPPL